jgi:L-asparaginase/Glu-tRNA(Gln) amidotransferase subunit D
MKVGAMFAGDLSGVKTRVLLAVLLGAGLSPEEIRQGVESRGL